ncbi:hypothetical protein ACFYW6_34950 [Streptomyces sp. NPDC002659]|uniref:hypothetical protein n=1 Tax=Streptomyces sp. NPDC002659 TaxID=3364656 RepID=UPI0036C8B788
MATHLVKLSWPLGTELLPSDALAALVDAHAAPIAELLRTRSATKSSIRLTGARTAPDDTAQCAALLLAAETLLGDRAPASLRERVLPLAREAYKRSTTYTGRIVLTSSNNSTEPLRAMAIRAHGFQRNPKLRPLPSFHRYGVEEVPSFLPKAWFDTHFIGFIERIPSATRWTPRSLRRAASLLLTEIVAGGTWTECARKLGVPPGFADKLLTNLGRQLNEVNLWPEFENLVERIACHLDDCDTRINYAHRRQAMAEWSLPNEDWLALCRNIPWFNSARAKRDPTVGSILVWSEVTQGEHQLSPAVKALRQSGTDPRNYVNYAGIYYRDLRQPRLILRQRLDRYASLLATACDQERPLQIQVDEAIGN